MTEPQKFMVEFWLVDGKLECKNITPFSTAAGKIDIATVNMDQLIAYPDVYIATDKIEVVK